MRKNKFLTAVILPAVLLVFSLTSCTGIFDINQNLTGLGPLGENQFYAINFETNRFYIVDAEKLAVGETVVIWAEIGSGVTPEMAEEIAYEFDNIIRPKVVDAFSMRDFPVDYLNNGAVSRREFSDILEFANWLAGGDDGKLTILLLDIQDGFEGGAYVAGYFFSGDFLEQGRIPGGGTPRYSNGRDMIYVDTNPGLQPHLWKQTMATLAHELQHLINFATSTLVRRTAGGGMRHMDTWIDEGLSLWTEFLYFDHFGYRAGRCRWFIEDPAGTIARGNNFFVWGNNTGNPLSILDEYATAYLFFRWLYLQAANRGMGSEIFFRIITSPYHDYRAVTSVAREINEDWGYWENLLRTWLAANSFPGNPHFGYIGDSHLISNLRITPLQFVQMDLLPGEGVYSVLHNDFVPPSGSGRNIRYAGLSWLHEIDTSLPYAGEMLLTFNANPSRIGMRERGFLTGLPAASASRVLSDGVQTDVFKGPHVIDARDIWGRNQDADLQGFLPEIRMIDR